MTAMMETIPATELHQQLGSALMVHLVELGEACDVFVGVGSEEEEEEEAEVVVVADGTVSAPWVSAEERMRNEERAGGPGIVGRAVDTEKR